MAQESEFVLFSRSDGTKVACRIVEVLFIGKGERGTVLNFGNGSQVNVHEEFDEVLALLRQQF